MGGFISGDLVLKGSSGSAVVLDRATFLQEEAARPSTHGAFQAVES